MRNGDVKKLSPRQKEILWLLLNGFDAKSAARELGISVHTVNEHLREARRQLGVSSSREAARILAQAEPAPPNDLGPKDLGVAHPAGVPFWLRRLSPNRRATYAGVSLVILVAAAAVALSFANGGPVTKSAKALPGSGAAEWNPSPYKSRDLRLGAFDELRVSGPFKIGVFVKDGPAEIHLQGPLALLSDTIATVEGDTLSIHFREGAMWSWNPGSGVNIVVTTPNLASAVVERAADVTIYGAQGYRFAASTEGAATIAIKDLNVRNVQLATGGSGGITAEGRAVDGIYVVGGPGPIDAKRLQVENASIAIGGAGSAYGDVSKIANVSVDGTGHVEIVGGAKCIKQPTDSRQIDCR